VRGTPGATHNWMSNSACVVRPTDSAHPSARPPAELGIHPGEGPTFESGVRHQLSFMCDDIHETIADLRTKGTEVRSEPRDDGYGVTTTMLLPGGLDVMLYEPRHDTAI
jgi:hypothetical protein